jgi:L-aspartate oxidase
MSRLETINTDVLVLGSGLAGMRAAWAALEAHPGLNVVVVSQGVGPSGSSFANINNKLGIQVCITDREREAFVEDAISIAPPGFVDPVLVQIMAEESEVRFRDLVNIGFPFDKDAGGSYFRTTGCFSPESGRAFIFTGLSRAFAALKKKLLSMSGQFLEGWLVQDLIKSQQGEDAAVCGALIKNAKTKEKLAVRSKSVIFALGGPAALFALNVAGPGTHGFVPALLNRVGAHFVNVQYLQFLWHTVPGCQFWPIQELAEPGAHILGANGEKTVLPENLRAFAAERGLHCPVSYGLKDEAIDHYLIEQMGDAGAIEIFTSEKGRFKVALMAHAGNGGAKIDNNSSTGVAGLYACGECAGGMHGANRIGGGMVLSTQVFGERAGRSAAMHAKEMSFIDRDPFAQMVGSSSVLQIEDDHQWCQGLIWLRRGLQAHAIPGYRPGRKQFMDQCRDRLAHAVDWRWRLALESALIIGGST